MAHMEKVINALENCVRNGVCINCEYEEHIACKTCIMADALELLKELKETNDKLTMAFLTLPDWNPVIVRCKDCKHWIGNWCNEGYTHTAKCTLFHYPQPADWFCADGERK